MTIQKILVPFLVEDAGESALKTAIAYARQFKAHLDAVHLRQHLTVASGSYYPITVTYIEENVTAFESAQNELASKLKSLFEAAARNSGVKVLDTEEHDASLGVTARWSDLDASLAYDLSMRARVADMVALARPKGKTSSHKIDLLEDIIFQAGRSALVVNIGEAPQAFPKTVVVAWDGGRESARAMSAALPILAAADQVIVMTAGEMAWAAETPERAAAYLRLHNVHATHLHARVEKGEDAAEVFLKQAQAKGADLIVMGAYSHHRWREVLLGGFTKYLLQNAATPLLMTH